VLCLITVEFRVSSLFLSLHLRHTSRKLAHSVFSMLADTAYPGKSDCGSRTASCPPRYLATTLVNGRRHKVLGGKRNLKLLRCCTLLCMRICHGSRTKGHLDNRPTDKRPPTKDHRTEGHSDKRPLDKRPLIIATHPPRIISIINIIAPTLIYNDTETTTNVSMSTYTSLV